MDNKDNIVKTLTQLGVFLSQFNRKGIIKNDDIIQNNLFFDEIQTAINLAESQNGWFTRDNVLFAFEQWANTLTESNISLWLDMYSINCNSPKKVAIIMAGNIPLVGFHDFISVILSGHNVLVKQSSNDKALLPIIVKYLITVNPTLKNRIEFTDGKLEKFDAVIATGSDNTARYFEYYFKEKPSIIRKNRNSVAVLTGNESIEELQFLGEDIFRYYGLGCRNVSKLFVPKNYDFTHFFESIYHWHPIINKTKYANNYDYNKAVYLMSEFDLLENGFLMLKEDESYSSPIATLFYEYYENIQSVKSKLSHEQERIQCIVSNNFIDNEVAFGETQKPKLWNYADNLDTVDFLLKI